jgi:hypothetical protein
MDTDYRGQALDSAVRISLAKRGEETAEETVARAEAFEKFLTRDPEASASLPEG